MMDGNHRVGLSRVCETAVSEPGHSPSVTPDLRPPRTRGLGLGLFGVVAAAVDRIQRAWIVPFHRCGDPEH